MSGVRIGLLCLLVVLGAATRAWAELSSEGFDDFSELSLEDLLDQEVVSASKYAQRVTDAPVPATVITAEEIRASGATSIPELLRTVPGLDVIGSTATTYDVSARGAGTIGANTTLVMIDGRSVYEGSYGVTLWEFLPISMDEIKSIEVILGPGSALYGANAFAGVIHILTEAPGETERTVVRGNGTAREALHGSVLHSGRNGRLRYRLSGGSETYQDWENRSPDGHMTRLNADLRWSGDDEVEWGVSGGYSNGVIHHMPGGVEIDMDGHMTYARVEHRRGDLQVRGFVNNNELLYTPYLISDATPVSTLNSVDQDLEFQHAFRPFDSHRVTWGGSYRNRQVEWSSEGGGSNFDLYSGFLFDEWSPDERWIVSGGMRYDHHPLVGSQVSPRGGIVFKPAEEHAIRFSAGEAFRNPTHLENFLQADLGSSGLPLQVRGDPYLAPTRLRALDLGYQGLLHSRVLGGVSLFRLQTLDVISLEPSGYHPVPPAPFPGILSELTFVNVGSRKAMGGEVFLEIRPLNKLRIRANYSYLWQYRESDGTRAWVSDVPKHKFNVELRANVDAQWTATLWSRYRSRTEWENGLSHVALDPLDGWVVFDARVAWQPSAMGPELAVTAYDLFDKRYREHPLSIEHRRRINVGLMTDF